MSDTLDLTSVSEEPVESNVQAEITDAPETDDPVEEAPEETTEEPEVPEDVTDAVPSDPKPEVAEPSADILPDETV